MIKIPPSIFSTIIKDAFVAYNVLHCNPKDPLNAKLLSMMDNDIEELFNRLAKSGYGQSKTNEVILKAIDEEPSSKSGNNQTS
jgi:hypothetical protein